MDTSGSVEVWTELDSETSVKGELFRILFLFGVYMEQLAGSHGEGEVVSLSHLEVRCRYKRWSWWEECSLFVPGGPVKIL